MLVLNLSAVFKIFSCSLKSLQIDVSVIINCNTFSAVPSIINDNVKNVLFHYNV